MTNRVALSRRACLKGFAAVAGAAIGTRIAGRSLIGSAGAAPAGKAAIVSVFFEGGFNALFSSPDSFLSNGAFGVNATNVRKLANDLFVDSGTIGTLGDWALSHMAAIGVRHGATDHISAQKNNFMNGSKSFVLELAAAMGGDAAFKAAALGGLPVPGSPPPERGVSLQLLRTMGDVSTALGLGAIDFQRPARNNAGTALARAQRMSAGDLKKNPSSMAFARDGYATLAESLAKPPLAIDVAKVAQAYNVSTGARLESLPAKLAAAELMVRAGTNVVTLSDTGWDTHGDRSGQTVRRRMGMEVIPALKTFISRMRSEPELASMNITVILHGDFARSLPSSDHAPALSALVIGPNVKVGTTGKVSANVTLPENTGGAREMWSYLAALAKVRENPFGPNPHPLVL